MLALLIFSPVCICVRVSSLFKETKNITLTRPKSTAPSPSWCLNCASQEGYIVEQDGGACEECQKQRKRKKKQSEQSEGKRVMSPRERERELASSKERSARENQRPQNHTGGSRSRPRRRLPFRFGHPCRGTSGAAAERERPSGPSGCAGGS